MSLIAQRRHQLGLTQQEVVDRLTALGVAATNRTLSAMEHGQGIDVGRMPELAAALDCTVTYLLGLTSQPQQWVPDEGSRPGATDGPEAAGSWHHGLRSSGGGHPEREQHVLRHLTSNSRASLRRFTDPVAVPAGQLRSGSGA